MRPPPKYLLHSLLTALVISAALGLLFWGLDTPPATPPDVAGLPTQPGPLVPFKKTDLIKVAQNDPAVQRLLKEKYDDAVEYQQTLDFPIRFHGKIVDQYGQPVPTVEFGISILHYDKFIRAGFMPGRKVKKVVTDAEGRFTVKERGHTLALRSFTKDGYAFKSSYSFGYGHGLATPMTPDKPFIVQAHKIDQPQAELTMADKLFGFIGDKRPYTLDLLTGKKHAGHGPGDIHATAYQNPKGSERTGGEWFIKLEAVNGGFIDTTDQLMYLAPESGYTPTVTLNPANTHTPDGPKKLYLRARNGQVYGRLELKAVPYYREDLVAFFIRYWVNPNGSRNLYTTEQPYRD